ncbi:MAG TPA: ATP-binding protein [Roseiarcus sp.]|nr:ATP-binding protein [Roseiarcus sp.]
MFLLRLIGTASFRLAATYLAVFSLSVVLLGWVVYLSIGHEIVRQIDERVAAETAKFSSEFKANGLAHLAAHIRSRKEAGAFLDYRLEDNAGRLLAGSLPSIKAADGTYHEGWTTALIKTEYESDQPDFNQERALITRLDDGSVLIVGDELGGVEEARRAVLIAFGWALAAMIVIGVGGGVWLSAAFLRRIDVMTTTAQDIIKGDLARRIPLAKGDADLARLAGAFNKMLDRIGGLLEANRHVSSAIAHDLRRPLARALRGLETVRSEPSDLAKYEKAVDAASGDINNILETFSALLRIGEIETGARRAGFQDVDLAAIALEVAEAFQPAAADEGKVLTFELGERLPMVGDRELLTQMTANLIDNSIRHTPPGSHIEVKSLKAEGARRLIVADDGPGVRPSERGRIFERFFRVDSSRATPGDGLGLSLVAAIAGLHDATVAALDNEPGLKIVIDLPAAA